MEPVQGEPWPMGRSGHAACCLNYGKDSPMLVMFGGLDDNKKVLGDLWVFDVNSGKWREVSLLVKLIN